MKKIRNLLLLTICLSLIIINIPIKAETINTPSFNGTITPKYDFMVGDVPSPDDFIINGYVSYRDKTYKLNDLLVLWQGGGIEENKSEYSILIVTKENYGIHVLMNISVNVIDFNSALTSNIEGKNISVDKINTLSDDGMDKIRYTDNLNIQMTDSTGKVIDGKLKISKEWYSPRIGHSDVTYRFIPDDKRYKTYYGKFSVDFKVPPRIKTTKTGIRISLSNRDKRYTFKINGKSYKKNIIGKLKSDTKYKIEIIQNTKDENGTLTSTNGKSLYVKTVKTKPLKTK